MSLRGRSLQIAGVSSYSSNYLYYYYFALLKVFTPALADGFPLESKWQQIWSSSLDFSQYFGRSQQCCSLNGLHSSSYFQVLQSLYLWWLYQAHQLQLVSPTLSCSLVFFSSLARSKHLNLFSLSFNFTLWSAGTAKSTIRQVLFFCFFLFFFFFFLLTITRSGRLTEIWWSIWISKFLWILRVPFSLLNSGLCIYYLFAQSNLKSFAQFPVDLLPQPVVSGLILFLW